MTGEYKIMNKVGVVIGRFQVPKLHVGHRILLDTARRQNNTLVVLVGTRLAGQPVLQDPLPFESIKHMILQYESSAVVLKILDVPDDNEQWSRDVDFLVAASSPCGSEPTLYGSRDSFIQSYQGEYRCQYVDAVKGKGLSGTQIRERVGRSYPRNHDERQGAIWALENKFINPFPCVDVAIMAPSMTPGCRRILLGRKKNEDKWRLPGGFVDPGETWEQAAIREVREETGMDVRLLKYLGSFVVNDSRYRGTPEDITTSLFLASSKYMGWQIPIAFDDLEEAEWFEFEDLSLSMIVQSHQRLIQRVREEYRNEYSYVLR
jgi:bifunctional NMN adenylyltransferase/nudix hydrolase